MKSTQFKHILTEAWFDKFIRWTKGIRKAPRVATTANKLSPARLSALEVIGQVLETNNTKRWLRSQSVEQLEKLKAGIKSGTVDANYIKRMSEKYVAGANTAFYYRNTFFVYNADWYKMIQGMSSISNIADVGFSHYSVLAASNKMGGINTLISDFNKLKADGKLITITNFKFDSAGKGQRMIDPRASVIGFTDLNTAKRIANELNQQLKNSTIGKKYSDKQVVVESHTGAGPKYKNPKFNPRIGDEAGNREYYYSKQTRYIIKLPIFDVRVAID
jgi:hypothetical protein